MKPKFEELDLKEKKLRYGEDKIVQSAVMYIKD